MDADALYIVDKDRNVIRNLAKSTSNLTGASESGQLANNNSMYVGNPAPISSVADAAVFAQGAKTFKTEAPMLVRDIKSVPGQPQDNFAVKSKTNADSIGTKKTRQKHQVSTRVMVLNSIKTLNEPGGSSLQKIKKFIYANYDVNRRRVNFFIRRYLKKAYVSGELVQKKRKPFNIHRKFQIAHT